MHGGITPPRGTSLRYPEVAMNDVWVSRSGKSWDLITPGCLPHVIFLLFSPISLESIM